LCIAFAECGTEIHAPTTPPARMAPVRAFSGDLLPPFFHSGARVGTVDVIGFALGTQMHGKILQRCVGYDGS
jgi:hypothetical protein